MTSSLAVFSKHSSTAYHDIHYMTVKAQFNAAMVLVRDPGIATMPFSCTFRRQEGTKQKTDWGINRQEAFV